MARQIRKCPDCGRKTGTLGAFCPYCATELTPEVTDTTNKEEENEMRENNNKRFGTLAIVAIVAIVALALMLWHPWSGTGNTAISTTTPNGKETMVIDKNVKITGDLEVEGNATVKGQLTAAVIVSETDILAKRNIVAEETVQGKVVQATEKVIAPEVHTNKVVTQSVETTNNQVVVQPKSEGSIVNNVVEQPAQQPVVRQQQVVRQQPVQQSTTTTNSAPVIHNYAETGVGKSKNFTLVVRSGNIGIVGGYTVNGQSNGVYRAYSPGTYSLAITDGFIYEVDQAHAKAEFNSRVSQARNSGWACSIVDYGPLN